jgi:DNA primase
MTVEEIKSQYSMADIVTKYGYKISRAGFISCPFHKGDRTASMKIYKDSFHCFGCGASGDIFGFVQMHDNCDFKSAFYSLGGGYAKRDFKADMGLYRLRKAKEKAEREKARLIKERQLRTFFVNTLQKALRVVEPMSDAWCYLINELETELYKLQVVQEEIERR